MGGESFLEKIQSAGNVRVDKFLIAVGGDVGLVQCGGVQDEADAAHGVFDEVAIGDRADAIGEGRRKNVDAKSFPARCAEGAHEGFAEMSRAAGDQNRQRNSFEAFVDCREILAGMSAEMGDVMEAYGESSRFFFSATLTGSPKNRER